MTIEADRAPVQPSESPPPEVDAVTVRRALPYEALAVVAAGAVMFAGLYAAMLYDYDFFHVLAEGFAVVVGLAVFMLVWNSRKMLDNDYLLFIGIAFAFVAVIDSVHMMAYAGMHIFTVPEAVVAEGPAAVKAYQTNMGAQLWISARYIQAASLLVAPVFLNRRLNMPVAAVGFGALTSLFIASIFTGFFPICFVDGSGLTAFKISSEFAISAILLAGVAALYRARQRLDARVFQFIAASMLVTVASELSFTLYVDTYGFFNMLGHFLKIVAFYLIYRAVIVTGLAHPQDAMYRSLKESRDALSSSESRLRAVYESMDEGLADHEIVYEDGKAIDYVVTGVNHSYERITGITRGRAVGARASDLYGTGSPPYFDVYAKVAETGKPVQFETDFDPMGLSFSISVFSPAKGRFVTVFSDITERRRSEVNTARMASFPELNPNPIVEFDKQGILSYINPAAKETFPDLESRGSRHPFMEGWEDIVRELAGADGKARDHRVADAWFDQYFRVTPSGSIRLYARDITERKRAETEILHRANELKEANDELSASRLAALNIMDDALSARKDAERANAELLLLSSSLEKRVRERTGELEMAKDAVENERRRFREVLDMLPAYLVLISPDYRVPFANRFFEERFGKAEGRCCYEYLFKRDKPCENCETFTVRRTNAPHRWEWLGPDGRNYDIYDFPFMDSDGSPLILEMGLDITARKKAELELGKYQANLEAIITERTGELRESTYRLAKAEEIAHLGSWVLDIEKNALTWSDEVYRIFGLVPQEFEATYEAFLGRIHPDDRAMVDKAYKDSVSEGRNAYEIEHRIVRKGTGEVRWVHERCRHQIGESGKVVRSIGMVLDVTDRKAAERKIATAQETLIRQEKLAAMGAIAGGMAHDLRNPLAALKNAAYFLRMAIESPGQEVRESLDIMDRDIAASERIIADMLEFARTKPQKRIMADIGKLVGEALSRVDIPKNIEVRREPGETGSMLADPDQIAHAMSNLMWNAVQAMPDGGRLTIAYRIVDEPEGVSISVGDTGAGIREEDIDRLFDPLFTTKAKGTGLGLTRANTLVEMHGGRITVKSKAGEGSTFTVFLPVGGIPEAGIPGSETVEKGRPTSATAIVEIDENGVLTFASNHVDGLVGIPPNELVGKSVFDFFHPDDAESAIESKLSSFRTGRVMGFEGRVRRGDGKYMTVSVSGRVIDSEGEKRLVAVVRDASPQA